MIDLAGQETSADRSVAPQDVKSISNGINKDLVPIQQILELATSEKPIQLIVIGYVIPRPLNTSETNNILVY